MNGLNAEQVAIIRSEAKGAWLKRFDESVEILNTSAAQDAWTPRGSVKANSGFYQGTGIRMPRTSSYLYTGRKLQGPLGEYDETAPNPDHEASFSLSQCLSYGSAIYEGLNATHIIDSLETMTNENGKLVRGKHSMAFIRAWVSLCEQKRAISEYLQSARPAPTVTAIGLSPKVTATLKEMNLDVVLPSIKLAAIKYRFGPKRNANPKSPEYGQIMLTRDGSASLIDKLYYVAWTPGTKHGVTRFSNLNCNCEACGKRIPSGMFVAIEADDNKLGHVGMWIGCDCAKNIFGVKDIGVERN